jgi:hypothetical protein
MKKVIFGTALVISTALLACNNSETAEVDKSIIPDATTQPVTSVIPDSSQAMQVINQGTTAQPTVTTSPTTPAKTTAINVGGSSAPNPAHGQPGHRCDIAVGAPLNSPATVPTQPKMSQAVAATPAPSAAVPVSTDPNAKLNPAHGQPGHDCSIAVGAPLKKN